MNSAQLTLTIGFFTNYRLRAHVKLRMQLTVAGLFTEVELSQRRLLDHF
jgi:hypothetical protein